MAMTDSVPKMMKAAVLYEKNDLRFVDWPVPQPGPEDILIRVRATGICGSDVPRVLNGTAHFYPIILGHEFSGDVVEVGSKVQQIKPGDMVAGIPLLPCFKCGDCEIGNYSLCSNYGFIGSRQMGSFAEYVCVPERNAVVFQPSCLYEYGALVEPCSVALHGIMCNHFTGGRKVAVLGGGTIGLFTAQWARLYGAQLVTVFDKEDERLRLAGKMGFDSVVHTIREDYASRATVETHGQGYDYVFDTSGVEETIHMTYEVASNHAYICFVGTPQRSISFTREQWEIINRKELHITGSWMSYSAPFPGLEWKITAEYLSSGRLICDQSMIYQKYPLSKAAEAFALYQKPGAVKGKIILEP